MRSLLILLLISTFIPALYAEPLLKSFQSPPHSAKPHTWYHFMAGNISREGITEDLEAMADAGIGGIILFNVTIGVPNGPVTFNSPEHIELTAFTAAECQRLGLSFGIHNCDGWTSSGGPWVPVEHSMKRVVYRELFIDGGTIDLRLPSPTMRGDFYRDIAVIAYPSLDSEIEQTQFHPVVTSSAPGFHPHIATNGKLDERTELSVSDEGTAWIQWDFGKPFTARSFYLNTEKQRPRGKYFLQTSNDGKSFTTAHELKLLRHGKYEYSMDHSFPPLTARYFRFVTEKAMDLAEIELSATQKFTELNGRLNIMRHNSPGFPVLEPADPSMVIAKDSIVDLTSQIDAKGRLKTKLPKGKWTVMRFGYTTTAAINDPASIAGTGWEVDKFSRESFEVFWEGYVRNVINAVKEVAPGALQYVEIDSYEVGGQNWTKGYEDEFEKRHGYSITNFLPLYAGRYVESANATDRVLWDIRRFNNDLMCENYFDNFDALCEREGLKSILEPYGNGPFNQLDAARKADIPMGEFHASSRTLLDSAISAGHIYGHNIISAEAFTSGPQTNFEAHPGKWKSVGDRAWALGVNKFVFHTFAHQANTKVKPGMTMNGFGAQINRNQTWWETAGKSWFQYIARGQHLLRQGVPVSDLLVFVGDGAPNGIPNRSGLDDLPNHINYDGVNADVLINRISVKDGKLVLPEGTRYHALVLRNNREITLTTLKRLNELSEQGALILGAPPRRLGNYALADEDIQTFETLVSQIWSRPTTSTESSWEKIYADYKLPIDLKIENGESINYAHRKTETEDIYFFYNPEAQSQTFDCTFNVEGKLPEYWDPVIGEITVLNGIDTTDGQTKVAVPIAAQGAAFVIFRQPIQQRSAASNAATPQSIDSQTIDGPWTVTFPELKAGPQTLSFEALTDWTDHSIEGVKHYSGTAIYEKTIHLDESHFAKNRHLTLDLGTVEVAARVDLND
ncbi:glycosyl hydrolase, partial [Pelagicoccus enzymogenes]|uniref:glycosyl hydrolase n=1 Tax=Pelagicoccus enzymogenes TaxID=2773457 RepID=UPI00280E8A35